MTQLSPSISHMLLVASACVVTLSSFTLVGCANADGQTAKDGANDSTKAAPTRAVSASKSDATRVEIAVLDRSAASLEATMPAEVQGSRDAVLASAQGGPVERVMVREGDQVKQGQILVRVDSAMHALRKEQVQLRVSRAERDLERSLSAGGALPAAERERRESEVRMLKNELELASLQLERAVIRAPFSGVVARLDVETGEVVAPAAPLLQLVRLDPVHVVLSVPDRDVIAVQNGMTVDIRIPAQEARYQGTVARIHPTGDSNTRTFRVEVEVANPDLRILPGMIATASIARTLDGNVIVIPQDWLVTRRDGLGVFLDEDGKARYREVKAAQVLRDQVVISEGLEAGARLVITGHRELADNDALMITREGRCCTDGRVRFE